MLVDYFKCVCSDMPELPKVTGSRESTLSQEDRVMKIVFCKEAIEVTHLYSITPSECGQTCPKWFRKTS